MIKKSICILFLSISIFDSIIRSGQTNNTAIINQLIAAGSNSTESLGSFDYGYAGVLPRTKWPTKTSHYVLIGLEASGKDKGTWDVFGGNRDNDEHPVLTAARELGEETCELINVGKTYIDVDSGNTYTIVANKKKKSVYYITTLSIAHWRCHS